MPFEKGHKKIGGRTKGAINRKTFREIFEEGLGKSIPERLLELCKQRPSEEKDILKIVLPYSYAKLQNIEMSGSVDTTGTGLEAEQKIQELADKLSGIKKDL